MARVGVLALQGDFVEHEAVLKNLGADVALVRLPCQLDGLCGLIIPGGESTTISRLLEEYSLAAPLRERTRAGFPVWGTCAGAIVLAREVDGVEPNLLGVMDMSIQRNAFGRQVDSFETDLPVEGLGPEPFHAVFIRAPIIRRVGEKVRVLARLEDGTIVAARQENLLAISFHPELTDDARFHRLFLDMADIYSERPR